MKKVFAMLLSLALVLSLAVSASAASITITPNVPSGGSSTVEVYNAYKIFDATFVAGGEGVAYTISSDSSFYGFFSAENDYVTLTATADPTVFSVTKKDGFTDAAALATALQSYIANNNIAATQTSSGNEDTITGLANGYYLVTDTLGTALMVQTLGDVTVATKNAYPSLTKVIVNGNADVESVTANRGDEVNFKITVTIPATADPAKDIIIHDELPTGMTYQTGSVFGASYQAKTCDSAACDIEFVLDITDENVGQTVAITYVATVDADAATATALTNSAYLTYSEFTSTKDDATVYTYQIDVWKYTSADGSETALAGAGFVLSKVVDETTYYLVDTNGAITWTTDLDAATVKTSDANGELAFIGLANGTYTLIEKVTPAGYNKAADTTVTIADANQGAEHSVKVLNNTGSELPSTGGMGTTIFYVVGAILMAGAAVVMITKKRVSNV